MGQFIAAQRDYFLFVSLFAFIICTLECVVLNREENERRWFSFLAFYLFQCLGVIWALVSPLLPVGPRGALLGPLLQSVSFGGLFAFGPRLTAVLRHKLGMAAVGIALLAVCACAGLVLGAAPYSAFTSLLIGAPGTVLAARFLLSDPSVHSRQRPWLVAHAWIVAGFGLLALLDSAFGLIFHDRFELPALGARVCVSLALAGTLSMHEWRSFARLNRGYGRRLTRLVIYGSFLALPVLLVVGGIIISWLGQNALDTLRSRYRTEIDGVLSAITAQTGEIDRDVSIITGSPVLVQFLKDRDEVSHAQTLELLNRTAHALEASCYLLNGKGKVVASSTGAPDSFVAASHERDRWFRDAEERGAGRSFSIDLPAYARGYHASAAVVDLKEGVRGAAVVVKDILSLFSSSGTDQTAFLVNENGLIFYAIPRELTFRLLWHSPSMPMHGGRLPTEFGLFPSAPLLSSEPVDGGLVSWDGSNFVATRSFLPIPGWSVVHLGPTTEILQARLAGLLVTLIVILVIAIFSAVGQMSLLDEARIERSESLYRALIEGSPDWISIVDPKGTFIFTNRAGKESLGVGSGSTDGSIERLLGPDHVATLAGNVQFALRGGVLLLETVLPTAAGEEKSWHLTLVPLETAGREPTAILIGSDVTEMRGAEARLVRAERMAALGTLAAGVAHQFNNINAVAMGYLQVLEAEPDLSERAKKYLGSVRTALERSVLIASRLLPLSAPQIEQDPAFLLEDAVRSTVALVQADLDRERVTLELDLEPGVAASINGEQLGFIVEALLVNAWHATLGREVRRIQVGTGSSKEEAFLSVEDSGIGIQREKLSSLFTPFFTEKGEHAAPQSPQARVQGVGLSLAVAHSMVSARGGRIEIQSEQGGGSRFTVWLPRG